MNPKLTGLVAALGLSLGAQAQTYTFTPIRNADNTALQSLGRQLAVDVSQGTDGNVLFTFSNPSSDATISRIYLDDAPSNLFSNVSIANESSGVDFSANRRPGNLVGGNTSTYGFQATEQFSAVNPVTTNGLTGSGETLTLAATPNEGVTFADVVNSLNTGNTTNRDGLRLGIQANNISQFNNRSATFLDTAGASGGGNGGNGGTDGGGGATPPPPIPEPETYGMLMAGLGLMAALSRRRRA